MIIIELDETQDSVQTNHSLHGTANVSGSAAILGCAVVPNEGECAIKGLAELPGVPSSLGEHQAALKAGKSRPRKPVEVGVSSQFAGGDHGAETSSDACLPSIKS